VIHEIIGQPLRGNTPNQQLPANSQQWISGEPSQSRTRRDRLGERIQPDHSTLIVEFEVTRGQLLEELLDALLVVLEVVICSERLTGLFTSSRYPGISVEEVVRFILADDNVYEFRTIDTQDPDTKI
jgi:hypothetical protein